MVMEPSTAAAVPVATPGRDPAFVAAVARRTCSNAHAVAALSIDDSSDSVMRKMPSAATPPPSVVVFPLTTVLSGADPEPVAVAVPDPDPDLEPEGVDPLLLLTLLPLLPLRPLLPLPL